MGSLNITTGAAASTVAVTGLSFQPTCVIFWWNGLTAASNGTRQTSLRGIGVAASSSSFFAQANYDEDAAATSVCKNNYSASYCIMQIDNTGAIVGGADLQSFDSGGFTLEIQDAFPTDLLVSYMAIGGTDNVELGTFTPAGVAPVNQTVNNAGNFQPTITLFFPGSQVSSGADAFTMIGAATSSSDEHVHFSGANDGGGSGSTASYNRSGECVATLSSLPTTTTVRAEFVSHNAGPGGFTINWLERGNANAIQYLSIKGGNWIIGDFLSQTDTTTAMTESGFGFTPAGAMFVSAGKAESAADTPDTHDEWSIGAATSASSRVCQQMDSRSGNTTMFVHPAARTDCVYIDSSPANTAYTLEGLADIQSFDSDGFTCIMDDADAAQAFVWYIALGNPAAAAGNTPQLMMVGVGN